MSMALQLQFFMVQAINYSVIIVKIKCKTHNIINRKRLPWCELINPYNLFFIVDMFYHTSRKTSRRDVKVSETLGSFKVSASVSNKILNVSVSETWVSGLVHILACRSPDMHTINTVTHHKCNVRNNTRNMHKNKD